MSRSGGGMPAVPLAPAGAMLVHGTCVAVDGEGVLLLGPPGAGKSDLALRLIDGGARLIADDQTALSRDGKGGLRASAPPSIAGLLEIRGVGIVAVPNAEAAPLRLAVELVADEARVERLPEARHWSCLGVEVPLLVLMPFPASTPAKIRVALRALASQPLAY
jgi:serine kinase of HPr protein (carbohydrate metabolism regulator)